MNAVKIKISEIVVVGFALFAMFFGAGNLIFPPSIGVAFGDSWSIGFFGFSLTGVLLPLLAVVAAAKAGGGLEDIGKKVFPWFGVLFGLLIVIFVGILFVIPRTGATTYEMAVKPLYPDVSPVVVSFIYFLLNVYFAINPSKIIDKIARFITPVLFVCLSVMILKGIFSPIGVPAESVLDKGVVFTNGFITGYQTADALAGLLFTGIVISSFVRKGITEKKRQEALTFGAAVIAISGLLLIYSGLTYLGASVSGFYDGGSEKTKILASITNLIMGDAGLSVFGVVVACACLSTSIGVTSAAASLFEKVTKDKIPYRSAVILISIFCAIFAVNGVESLINVSMPVLLVCYPISMVLIIGWLFYDFLPNDGVFPGAVLVAFVVSAIDAMGVLGMDLGDMAVFVSSIPLAEYGLSWVVPSIIGGVIGGVAGTFFYKKDLLEVENG